MNNKISIVLFCTKNYLNNALSLIKSLNLFHDNLEFYLYTLNFNYESDIYNVKTVYIYESRIEDNMSFHGNKNDVTNKNMFKSVFFKSQVILDSIDTLKLNEAIYVDSDIMPTGDISELVRELVRANGARIEAGQVVRIP